MIEHACNVAEVLALKGVASIAHAQNLNLQFGGEFGFGGCAALFDRSLFLFFQPDKLNQR